MGKAWENFVLLYIKSNRRRIAALEDRVERLSAMMEITEYGIKTNRERPSECSQCARDPDEVDQCADENCPMGL